MQVAQGQGLVRVCALVQAAIGRFFSYRNVGKPREPSFVWTTICKTPPFMSRCISGKDLLVSACAVLGVIVLFA